jgi:acylpyruvate hydrolase
MRLTTVRVDGGTSAGRVEDDEIVLLDHADVGALLASGDDWRERAATADGERIAHADADFAPLVARPEKIFCVGVNYRSHAEETGLEAPQHPTIFAKFHRSLIGPNDDIVLPANSQMVDWEAELGVVVGTPLRHASEAEAAEAIAGYTIVNDVSMRDWQLRTSQFLQGKTFEATTPVGPYLVTPDEVDGGDLRVTCTVNGELMQEARTSELLFSAPALLAYISQIITLVPGDLIATGTPAGIGAVRQPPMFLTDETTVSAAIEGLGEQLNHCRAAAALAAS